MRPRQTILLGLLLLVPVLAFLFLYGFGRNQYALPTYLPERADSVRLAGGGWRRDTVFHRAHLPPLLDAAGRSSANLPDSGIWIVQVLTAPAVAGPDVDATRTLARLQETFRARPQVRLATLLPVPAAEAPAATATHLQQLSERYGTIADKWVMLATPADSLTRTARYELGLLALAPSRLPFSPATDSGNLPAGRLLLLDRNYRVRGYYDATDRYEVDRLITEVNVLLYIDEHRH